MKNDQVASIGNTEIARFENGLFKMCGPGWSWKDELYTKAGTILCSE